MQDSRAPRREPQDSRSAHAIVRDQQWPALAQLRPGDRCFDIRNRDARQRMKPRRGNVQRKERRHRWDDGVSERLRDLRAGDRAGTAGGKQESMAKIWDGTAPVPPLEGCPPYVPLLGRNRRLPPRVTPFDSCSREKSHPGVFRFVQEAIDDGARRIRHRKHASIRFRLESNAVRLRTTPPYRQARSDGTARLVRVHREDNARSTSADRSRRA